VAIFIGDEECRGRQCLKRLPLHRDTDLSRGRGPRDNGEGVRERIGSSR
jgi:hypothetical protein